MNCPTTQPNISIIPTRAVCPIGEATGKKNIRASKIPVLSCEGACIRGEIARLAAKRLAKNEFYGRGCHGRVIEHCIGPQKLVPFDALYHYNRFTDIFDYKDVPEEERRAVAQSVADRVLGSLEGLSAEGTIAPAQTKGGCSAGCT